MVGKGGGVWGGLRFIEVGGAKRREGGDDYITTDYSFCVDGKLRMRN